MQRIITDIIIPYCMPPIYCDGYDFGYLQLEVSEWYGRFTISLRELKLLEQKEPPFRYEDKPFALLDPMQTPRASGITNRGGQWEYCDKRKMFLRSRREFFKRQFCRLEGTCFSGEIETHPQILDHWVQGCFKGMRAEELQDFLDIFSHMHFEKRWPRGAWTLQFEVAEDLSTIAIASTIFTPGKFDGYGLLFRERRGSLQG
ncbi:hypothetical protein HY622_01860 [Candidatus Uhrbacteria bacterium]|nr:hypothetical protein [Candidatus Uhrbacteria bacterium]